MKTIKSLLKALVVIEKQPLSFLSGYKKLTEEEERMIGFLTAEIANAIHTDEFQALLIKFKAKPQTTPSN